MNKEKFLSSGLLQQYVLGLTNDKETEEVEQYLENFPEVRQELAHMFSALDNYAEDLQIPKSPHQVRRYEKHTFQLAQKTKLFRLMSLLFFLIAGLSISFNVYLYREQRELQWELMSAEALNSQNRERMQGIIASTKSYAENRAFLEHAHTREIWLENEALDNGRAVVFWNPTLAKAMIRLLDEHKFAAVDQLELRKQSKKGADEHLMYLSAQTDELQEIPFFSSCARVYLRLPDSEVAVISSKKGPFGQ